MSESDDGEDSDTETSLATRDDDDDVAPRLSAMFENLSALNVWPRVVNAALSRLISSVSTVRVANLWLSLLLGMIIAAVAVIVIAPFLAPPPPVVLLLVLAILTTTAVASRALGLIKAFTTPALQRIDTALRAYRIKATELRRIAADMRDNGIPGQEIEEQLGPLRREAYRVLSEALDDERSGHDVRGSIARSAKKKLVARAAGASYELFLAHSGPDTPHAQSLYHELLRLDPELTVFMDRVELRGGDDWGDVITTVLENSSTVVIISSSRANGTFYRDEIKRAIDLQRVRGITIVPVRVDDHELPYGLGTFVPLSLRTLGSWEAVASEIVKTVRAKAPIADPED